MHNYAIFAIPGLMPPKAAHWRRNLIAPEDGSLRMLVYCGIAADTVNYTITIPGWRRGIIKDPTYKFENHDLEDWGEVVPCPKQVEKWPNFLQTATELPKNILIPRVMIHGCPILLTELCEDCVKYRKEHEGMNPEPGGPYNDQGIEGPSTGLDPEPETPDPPAPYYQLVYYYLDCPPRTLHVGDNVIEVVANGHLRKFIVQRPEFNIHRRGGITMRYRRFKPEEEEEPEPEPEPEPEGPIEKPQPPQPGGGEGPDIFD